MSGPGKSFELVKQIWDFVLTNHKGFDHVLKQVKLIDSGVGTCTAEMKVEEGHTNRGGTLHGGLTATLVDSVSTMALLAHPRQVSGVSVDIHVSYLKAAKIGEDIRIEAKTDRVGQKLAFLTVEILNKATGDLIAKGTHTKYIG